MKKLLSRIGMVLIVLVVLNWVYSKWFYERDLRLHSDVVELSWQVADDSCRIIYLGESSNNHYGDEETNRQKISDFTAEYFPEVKMGDLTYQASHAQTYYYMLKRIPKNAEVGTVVVTMNLRSFGANWIYSRLETALRKKLVLLEDYPPLFNRFLLAFKAYPIRTEAEWDALVQQHWRTDKLDFPYDFQWGNVHDWDSAMAWSGWHDWEGRYDPEVTALACHFIKSYAFNLTDDNPRVKDFDAIVALCQKRGWNLVFNLMAENVDKANELVGNDLMFLIKRNRDFLVQRYGTLDGVTVVDNLSLVRDVNFIDQDWTTEHYYEEGRRILANNLAQTLRQFYPDDYQENELPKYDAGHYFSGDGKPVEAASPFGPTVTLTADSLLADWGMVNVAFALRQTDTLHRAMLAVERDGETSRTDYYPVKQQVFQCGEWDFATFALPLDSTFFGAERIKFYVYNPATSAVQIKDMDVSFRPAYMKPRVKAQSVKSVGSDNGE